ncbi:uncharacterized protein LTR77_007282 [Saxophila tyrrhenica]|uniref:Phosducin domain-containing protein n=1 Tax=Saxophila tyrrhenica TaxID=1690608 RepID=A0AAV9P504_9PEZI|nr:hypothetical protein LTR77_007282 [Saxophila tyrrhenica]
MSAAQHEFDDLMRSKERRSTHPEDVEDEDDARSFLNLSDDENDTPAASFDETPPPRPSTSLARSTIPTTRYEANTGPKGVIADAQHFRDSRRSKRISLRSNSNLQAQIQTQRSSNPAVLSEKLAESDEELEEDDEDDDEFMREWRQSRLREMQSGTPRESKTMGREKSSRRLWGGLATVDGNGFLDAVEGSPEGTVVVVYIYDDYSHVSTSIEDCIRSIAQRHLDVRFVKLHFEDAEMEPAGVPALLAYRDGDKFAGLVPIIQEIPDDADLSARTLEMVLQRYVWTSPGLEEEGR